jgi:hypothetical protein
MQAKNRHNTYHSYSWKGGGCSISLNPDPHPSFNGSFFEKIKKFFSYFLRLFIHCHHHHHHTELLAILFYTYDGVVVHTEKSRGGGGGGGN